MATQNLRVSYAQLMYYAREKLWRHAENVCAGTIQALDDWVFRVWRAFCLDKQGMMNDALREYKTAESHRECTVPALVGMLIIYTRNKDTEGLRVTEQKLSSDRFAKNVSGWLQGAAMLWFSGDVAGAREMVSRFQEEYSDFRDEYTSIGTLRAWIDLTSGRGSMTEKCGALFKAAMDAESVDDLVDIDASLGRAAYFERKSQYFPAQDVLNKIIAAHPTFLSAIVVKTRYLMKVEDWDQAAEMTQRVLAKDPENIESIGLRAMYFLVKEAKFSEAGSQVLELYQAMMTREPKNAALFHQYSQCFSRISGGDLTILGATTKFAEAAQRADSRSAEYQCEIAYQCMLRGDIKAAIAGYRAAIAIADSGIAPMLGLVRCLVLQGNYDEAAKEIEFPNEMQSTSQRNAELCLLNAMLLWRRNKDQGKSILKLDQAAEAHKHDVASLPTGIDLYIRLNPPLMLEIAKEYVQHCRTEPPEPGSNKSDPIVEKCRRHLELLTRHDPGCVEGQLMLARMYFVSGDLEKANDLISRTVNSHQATPEAYILWAQAFQYMGNLRGAFTALEQALTLDFEIKDQPSYNLLLGSLMASNGRSAEAQVVLKQALEQMQSPGQTTGTGKPIQPLSVQDHVSLYLQLAQTYLKLNQVEEARNTVAQAARVFSETTQAGRVSIAHAMIVARTDVDKAIEVLRQVKPKSEYFIAAKTRMADLYLAHQQNRRLYAECFEEMVEAKPTSQSYMQLGEAYSKIQEPEKAIAAYEKAKAMDPNNGELAVCIGRAHVATHDYERALHYYQDAIAADETKFAVRADLATLQWRLGNSEQALEQLADAPIFAKPPDNDEDLAVSIERVNCALLMYKIMLHSANGVASPKAIDTLQKAWEWQSIIIETKLRGESPDTVHQQRAIATMMAVELGKHFASQRTFSEAEDSLREALKLDESSEAAMLGIARLHLSSGDEEECENQCNALLRINPDCDEAVMVLAELMFRRNRFDDAAHHFNQLLSRTPDNYFALVQFIELLRRGGRLFECEAALAAAEKPLKAGQRPEAGFSYAQGLFHHFTNNNREALLCFNQARLPVDTEWSQKAIEKMIDIYLTPDNENLWEDSRTRDETAENLKVAERLLMQLQDPSKRMLYSSYFLIASKKKESLQTAVAQLGELTAADRSGSGGKHLVMDETNEDEDVQMSGAQAGSVNVPATVALATALHLLKQTPKARSYVKLVASVPYKLEEADHFERGWLLLADLHIQNGKYDLAQGLLKRTIGANKSCSHAWELLGLIFEKEQSYRDAAECYENAWKLVQERHPGIGFKLAFNYMKAKRLVHSIDVCRKVLNSHPNYPRIRTDIMDVAYSMLRP